VPSARSQARGASERPGDGPLAFHVPVVAVQRSSRRPTLSLPKLAPRTGSADETSKLRTCADESCGATSRQGWAISTGSASTTIHEYERERCSHAQLLRGVPAEEPHRILAAVGAELLHRG
jgi:hypothetical protein